MAIASLKDLYLDELGDLYDAETQMIRQLPLLAEHAHAPELRDALIKHSQESRLHLERLDLIFTHWSERQKSRPCAGLAGIVQEADDRLNQVTTDDARDAAIIGVAQRIEHYEIAAYGCARTYARRLNRDDEARLLQETLDDEGRADKRLTEIAEAHINDDARSERDLITPPVHALRYVGADSVRTPSSGRAPLAIRNRDEDELGVFDGVIVAARADRPRYVVVDAGGLVAHQRYLLPIDEVSYDDRAQVLRANVPKEIAERYPRFDRDEFAAMSPADMRLFEKHLLEVFPRSTASAAGGSHRTDSPPEWLITGAWITVPPQYAEELSDDARSFTNEFVPDRTDVEAPDREQAVARERDRPTEPPPLRRNDIRG
jgi:ferritin-like metal-binding protein YciE